jgi:Histidine kinase-, DNA gyrase B-, and HSP90-like ATPase
MPDAKDNPKYVVAVPARRFFVGMLIKDIELVPAIIDLVDNSIDGGKHIRPDPATDRYAGLYIKLTVSADKFEIEDNCGGIDLDQARQYAFRFGRPEDIEGPLGEVGQFGVGMKRALFKLGDMFSVTSTTTKNAFTLPVDVAAWMADPAPDWSFELSDIDEAAEVDESATGTVIEVTKLHDVVSKELANAEFVNRLRNDLRLRQARVIAQGMKIFVNGDEVEQFDPELLSGPELNPIAIHEDIPVNGDMLDMKLYAGVIRLRETDAERDDDDAEGFRQPPEAGWYLYCNDRLLVAADRTRLTGWGDAAASYHPQYRQFRGYVFLDGPARLMPWTTTKTAVDEDSPVFKAVQTVMFDALTKSQAAMNRIKKERQSNPDGERPAFDAVQSAQPARVEGLAWSTKFVLPEAPPPRSGSNVKWIRYSVDPQDFDSVAAELGVTAAVDVGRSTFEHYLRTQVPK